MYSTIKTNRSKQNKQKTVGTYAASKHVENWLKKNKKTIFPTCQQCIVL